MADEPCDDPVVEAVVALLRKRSRVGMKKYGAPLARDDLALADWLQHAMEETADNLNYLMAALTLIRGRDQTPATHPSPEAD